VRIPEWLRNSLMKKALAIAISRPPDLVIGPRDNPYLHRWHVLPKNDIFNIYLHFFFRPDDDRALHDHPWLNMSILVGGGYVEHVPDQAAIKRNRERDLRKILGGGYQPHETVGVIGIERKQGYIYVRGARAKHRIELVPGAPKPTTFFITGPKVREWGFWCPQGFVHWRKFTAELPGQSIVGPGCDQ